MSGEIAIETESGKYLWGDSLAEMRNISASSVNAVICSPPFEGESTIRDADRLGDQFVGWFADFIGEFERILPSQGVVAFELGSLWLDDASGKSVQHASFLRYLISRGWKLIQELYYFNPQLLRPQPAVGLSRLPDAITPIWLVSRGYTGNYQPDVAERAPYAQYIRGNLLEFDTSDKYDQQYERFLAQRGESPYADRWPAILPAFLIELLTVPGQTILDPFAGTGATCHAANRLKRCWIGIERDKSLSLHVNAMFSGLI
ncbi:site-specific DNA-methyltransferase (cytosine-N4-specific) [Erwinia toletana]|uniref:Methyltransferase n=1 Tax=Winslowiella toletana TaxID=92490 RepID=A0ABS4P406_9GAMM|nr:site-specific DNA-methyltransferase [Winslowiella toletana]MBP2167386.1 site-specific DNA-methyltransferase (cytosine-N4-specific) [Winslowiella toletana]